MSTDRSRRRTFSLAGRALAGAALAATVAAALTTTGSGLGLDPWVAALAGAAVSVALAAWVVTRLFHPLQRVLAGVSDGIRSFRDRDFSVRLPYRREDELGDLVELYNEVGSILQRERHTLRQRELLLATALDRSPAATLLLDASDRVIYANLEARALFRGGAGLLGLSWNEMRAGCPESMQEVLASGSPDGIFTVPNGDEVETYHLSQRGFQLNYRRHTLILLRRLTGELGRQEAEIWKKVIRIISHELNNSLAPVSSLVHSAEMILAEPRHAHRAEEVFGGIRERLNHLQRFIDGYARFARLPRPRPEAVDWTPFLEMIPEFPFEVVGPIPSSPSHFDPSQMQQVLVNLLKNAVEAADGEPRIELRIEAHRDGGTWLQVRDSGRGMEEEVMRRALLPFYTTKSGGSGLGLPLCREIVEGHGGRLSLQSTPGEGTVVTCWLPSPAHTTG